MPTGLSKPEFDAAAQILGNGWRMPTSAEFKALYDACLNGSYDKTTNPSGASASVGKGVYWCTSYDGVAGCLFCDGTNKLFFPAAGCGNGTDLYYAGSRSFYWSSSLDTGMTITTEYAYSLIFNGDNVDPQYTNRRYIGFSVRPVKDAAPAPTPTTTGTAKATIGGSQVDVKWIQLWENGPKFAEYNVGASSATDVGSTMTFTDATKAGADYAWGANWCTPSKDQMDELLKAATIEGSEKVNCEIVREGNVETGKIIGFKFTGKETGYTSNSVFFPAQGGSSYDGYYANYWSATADGSGAWGMDLVYFDDLDSRWDSRGQGDGCLVRPVFNN